MRTPDRLNVSKKSRNIIEKIDKVKFLNLDSNHTSRSELFTYAMAIGLDTFPTQLDNVHPGGLVLDSSISSKTKALMYSYVVENSKNKTTLDEVSDKVYVYNIVQELANTGFQIIEDYMDNYNEDELVWKFLKELDQQYERNVKVYSEYNSDKNHEPYAAETKDEYTLDK